MPNQQKTMELLEEASQKYERAKALHEEEDFETAVRLLQEAVKTNEVALGKYHKSTIKAYWRLGRSQLHLDMPAALVALKRAIRTCELSYGRDHTATKSLYEDVSKCLEGVGKVDDVVATSSSHSSSCGDSQQMDASSGKPNSGRSNMSISNDGSVAPKTPAGGTDYMATIATWLHHEQEGDQLCSRRKFPQAIKKYEQALEMEEKVFGGINNMDCADIMCKLACLHRTQGDFDKSEELYRKALAMFEATLGQDHPATRGAASHLKHLGQHKAKTWWGKTSSSFRRRQLDASS